MKKLNLDNAFRTGKSLAWALDNVEAVDGMDEVLETRERVEYELFTECIENITSSISYHYVVTATKEPDYDVEELILEHHYGIFLPQSKDGYKMLTIPLAEECEFQADDGELAYHYIGPNYVAVYMPEA